MPLAPNTTLSHYRIVSKIGAGGIVLAGLYARLGQKDEAFAHLEKGLQQHDFRITLVKVSFEFDSLRSDSRYADLVKRIGLPQ